MFSPTSYDWTDKRAGYDALVRDLTHLLGDERDPVANAAQAAALIWHALPDLNWAGFYFFDGTELVVGPFQGLPACTRIAIDRGVCGAAASRRASIVVPDVEAFPGHIACDSRSRSELVVPIVSGDGALRGVLDMDSPSLARFDDVDRAGVERLVAIFGAATAWPSAGGACD
jgi:L-methionine (R)-S-oxide reductase